MDIELAKTFLEVVNSGTFVGAAERLHVGQTTVSARIRLLEEQLGRPLFIRNKGGATLTPAGEQFLRFAPTFLQLWQRARSQVAVPAGHRAVLAVGSEVALWQPLLLEWVLWMRASLKDVALRVHVDVPQDLIMHVANGVVDAAIMYAPQRRPGVNIIRLMDERLVLARTTDSGTNKPYVHIDWGPEVALHQAADGTEFAPSVSFNLGPLALNYVLVNGGSGYFRRSAVEPHLASGRMQIVPDSPELSYPIYCAHSAFVDSSILDPALAGLRRLSSMG